MIRAPFVVAVLLGAAVAARAQHTLHASFQGSFGGIATAGAEHVQVSGPQCAAGSASGGAHSVQSGFLSMFSAVTPTNTAQPGESITQTVNPGAGTVVVALPPDTLPSGTVISLQVPASVPEPAASMASVANTAIEINSGAQPNRAVTLTFSYAAASLTGLDPARFVVARYDEASARWVPLISSVDPTARAVTSQTRHFSLFQVMQLNPAASVAEARAFPNPLRPAQGHTAMTFANLPANARVRIYTLRGALIKDISASAAGLASWDGTNESGAAVATGVYFVYAQGAGENRTLKVAVQR